MFCHCICVIKGNEHYQHHCRALHHTFVHPLVGSSLAYSNWVLIFKIEPSVRQCLAIKWWYGYQAVVTTEVIDVFAIAYV